MKETVYIPIKTASGLNNREHWRARAHRVKGERQTAALMVPARTLPCVVVMTRLSVGALDDDNLQGAMKSIRDGIADKLGINDNDPRVTWLYAQRKCKRGEFGVEVTIQGKP